MNTFQKNVHVIETTMDDVDTQFLAFEDKEDFVLINVTAGTTFRHPIGDLTILVQHLMDIKLASNNEEANELLEEFLQSEEETHTLKRFNDAVKAYAKTHQNSLSSNVYAFLCESEVTWINSSDAFSGPSSPKDYTICVDHKGDQTEFYVPYQAEVVCDSETLFVTEKELEQLIDVYIECAYYEVEE